MNYFFKFLVPAVIAFFCGAVDFLIANQVGQSTFAGMFCGLATALSYDFGQDNWDWKLVVSGLAGGLLGGFVGGFCLSVG